MKKIEAIVDRVKLDEIKETLPRPPLPSTKAQVYLSTSKTEFL